ncbi:hypothetical protein CBS101457_000187 [Exobasidium rhododendri]|nr:hypothetical protein CBS101457_000187 [Exobasidium rhododendri]
MTGPSGARTSRLSNRTLQNSLPSSSYPEVDTQQFQQGTVHGANDACISSGAAYHSAEMDGAPMQHLSDYQSQHSYYNPSAYDHTSQDSSGNTEHMPDSASLTQHGDAASHMYGDYEELLGILQSPSSSDSSLALQDMHLGTPSQAHWMPSYVSGYAPYAVAPQPSEVHQDTTTPWEYTLPVSPSFPYVHSGDKVYQYLSEDQKMVVVDRITQISPYTNKGAHELLAKRLDVAFASKLLSNDLHKVELAVSQLYHIDQRKRRAPKFVPWMTGLSSWQRMQVISLMAEATQQPKDELRDLFLTLRVTPAVARAILDASSPQQRRSIGLRLNLVTPENLTRLNWQVGLSELQIRSLLHRITMKGIDERLCYKYLARPYVPRGYGLQMLRAGEDEFMGMLQALIKKQPLP